MNNQSQAAKAARLQELIARAKSNIAKANSIEAEASAAGIRGTTSQFQQAANSDASPNSPQPSTCYHTKLGQSHNSQQCEAISRAIAGESFCLVGAAGTGKTTTVQTLIRELIQTGRIPLLDEPTKALAVGTAGIVVCSFTRVAVANIAKGLDFSNCTTIHNLLEYAPVYYEVEDANGNARQTMRFEPQRTAMMPLPASVRCIIIEEASMVGTELFQLLLDALPNPKHTQFIFLGDLNQLPPIYDFPILAEKLQVLPVIELTEVYRQALESPILALAHKIKRGETTAGPKLKELSEDKSATKNGKLTVQPWKKKLDSFDALHVAAAFLCNEIDAMRYRPAEDIILCPFNKHFGTIELNKHIANHIARSTKATVHEVIAGFEKHYLAEGDAVMVDKLFGTITKIAKNSRYVGKAYLPASTTLDRWGHDSQHQTATALESDVDIDAKLLNLMEVADEDRKAIASHQITVTLRDTGAEVILETAGEINKLLLGYALTVYKAQGSEWRKVYFLLHTSHNVALCRELLYTGITRASQELHLICEADHLLKGVLTQRIVGDTLAEKIASLNSKIAAMAKQVKSTGNANNNGEE